MVINVNNNIMGGARLILLVAIALSILVFFIVGSEEEARYKDNFVNKLSKRNFYDDNICLYLTYVPNRGR